MSVLRAALAVAPAGWALASCSILFAPPDPGADGGGDQGSEAVACSTDLECDDDIDCTLDDCDPASHVCTHQPMNDACDNLQPCDGAEICDLALGCVAGTPPDCDDHLDCTTDSCDPAFGGCVSVPVDADGDTAPAVACGGTDCDDTNAAVHPGATETCNGLDDDCNGASDEGFGCRQGATNAQSCGNCGTQSRTCSDTCTWGTWSACADEGECGIADVDAQTCAGCPGGGTEDRLCRSTCTWDRWLGCASCADVMARFTRSDFAVDPDQLQIFGRLVRDDIWAYASFDGTSDDTYVEASTPCTGEAPRTVATAWDIERKYVDANTYRLLVRGVSDKDCGEGGQATNAGEIALVAGSGWTIASTVRCEVTDDTAASGGTEIPTFCTVDDVAGTVTWQAGSTCSGCCRCAEAAQVNIEIVVTHP
jgi:hypothetical protein